MGASNIHVKKTTMSIVYDELLRHWIRCKYIDQKTKKTLRKELKKFDKKWNEYIRDP